MGYGFGGRARAREREALALRLVVAVLGLVPVGAGLDGVLGGSTMTGLRASPDAALDSQVRYLSGLLLAIGLAFWSTIPAIEARGGRFRLLTAIVVAGGLSRLAGVFLSGPPPGAMRFGLAMELVVTPALCAWQFRLGGAGRFSGRGRFGRT